MVKSDAVHLEMTLRTRDAEARRLAQTEFSIPLVLEAGAGTGKTTTLVARMVVWLLGQGWERAEQHFREKQPETAPEPYRIAQRTLQRLVAITFTEKAAAEMADRVAKALHCLTQGQTPKGVDSDCLPPEIELRSRELLSAVDQLQVSTIHAFCRRLLAEFPIEAGLRPDFELDSGEGAGEGRLHGIIHEILEARLREEAEQGNGLLTRLCELKIDLAQIPKTIVSLHDNGVRAEHLQIDPLGAAAIEALRSRMSHFSVLEKEYGECLQRLASSIRRNNARAKEVASALGAVFAAWHRWQDSSLESLDAMCKTVAEAWTKKAADALKAWEAGNWNTDETKQLSTEEQIALRTAVRGCSALLNHIQSIDLSSLRVLHDLFAVTLGEVQERARAQGIEKFSDLLQDARTLLVENSDIAYRVRSRIDQLLVDEFQDTDAVQCEIIEVLALRDSLFDGKAKAREKARSFAVDVNGEASKVGLFLVGDPKQSIYGWRSADLRAYDTFVAKVCQNGGKVYPLSVNYRSRTPILEEVERVVGAVMFREEGFQPTFEPLLSAELRAKSENVESQEASPAAPASIEYWSTLEWDAEENALAKSKAEDRTGLEAKAIAYDLRRLHADGVKWEKIGILFRSATDMEVYLRALREMEIPYCVEGGKQYYQRREIVEAVSLVCSILDPNDHLALLSWLRSVWVGIPDAALPLLWDQEFVQAVTNLHGKVSPTLFEKIDSVANELSKNREFATFSGLDRIVGWAISLKLALQNLATLRASYANDCAEDFIEKIRRLTLLEPIAAARALGKFRLVNLERFFRELGVLFEKTHGNVGEILHWLREAVSGLEDEDARPREGLEDAVQVMTIHKSKGLEFEHTYVVQMGKKPKATRNDQVVAAAAPGYCEYFALGQRTLAADELLAIGEKVASCERVRALYVAMTRAKHRLVLVGRWPERKDSKQACEEEPCDVPAANVAQITVLQAKSFAELFVLRSTGFPSFVEKMHESVQAENSTYEFFTNDGQVRWLFPSQKFALLDHEQSGTKMQQKTETMLAHAEIEAHSAQMQTLRREAQKYRERTFRVAASRVSAFLSGEDGELGSRAQGLGFDAELRDEFTQTETTQKSDNSKIKNPVAKRAATPSTTFMHEKEGMQERRAAEARIARAVGTALHRALENMDLQLDPAQAFAIEREALPRALSDLTNASERDRALERANRVLDGLATNGLLQRLFALRDSIVARELPLLLPPQIVELGDAAPRGFIAGTLDLLYCEPTCGESASVQAAAKNEVATAVAGATPTSKAAPSRWVVADYKTDFVTTSAEIDARAQHYAMQGELYCRAVQQALGLDERPRFELWFLAAGVVRPIT